MRSKPTLTADDVEKMMAACTAEAKKNNWKVSIAIVDDGGRVWQLHRLEGAGAVTANVALGKARTAAMMGRPSKMMEDRIKERPAFLLFPDILPIQGGVPILAQGECVGAIGVSGVQSHEDEQVANAGIAALG
jgi:glc operon protein GlcG